MKICKLKTEYTNYILYILYIQYIYVRTCNGYFSHKEVYAYGLFVRLRKPTLREPVHVYIYTVYIIYHNTRSICIAVYTFP